MTKIDNSKSEKKNRYLKNTNLYFQMLKDSENSNDNIPLYQLELAKLLSELDIFVLKIRLLLSISGVIFSIIFSIGILSIIYINYLDGYYYYFIGYRTVLINIFFLYLIVFIGVYSFKMCKKTFAELRTIAEIFEL